MRRWLLGAFERTDRNDLHHRLNLAEGRGIRTVTFSTDDLEPLVPSESMVLLHPGPTRGAEPHGQAMAGALILHRPGGGTGGPGVVGEAYGRLLRAGILDELQPRSTWLIVPWRSR